MMSKVGTTSYVWWRGTVDFTSFMIASEKDSFDIFYNNDCRLT